MPTSHKILSLDSKKPCAPTLVSAAKATLAAFPGVVSVALLCYGTSVFVEVVPTLLAEFVG